MIRPVTGDPSDLQQANPATSHPALLYCDTHTHWYLWSIWSDTLVSGPRGHGNISSSGLISQERRGGGGGDMDADCLGRDRAEDVGK